MLPCSVRTLLGCKLVVGLDVLVIEYALSTAKHISKQASTSSIRSMSIISIYSSFFVNGLDHSGKPGEADLKTSEQVKLTIAQCSFFRGVVCGTPGRFVLTSCEYKYYTCACDCVTEKPPPIITEPQPPAWEARNSSRPQYEPPLINRPFEHNHDKPLV